MSNYNTPTRLQLVAAIVIAIVIGLSLGYGFFSILSTLTGRIAVSVAMTLITGLATFSVAQDLLVVSFDGKTKPEEKKDER